MNRTKILVVLGIALAVILLCGAMVLLGGNLIDMIGAHLGI